MRYLALILDDDPASVRLIQQALNLRGFDVLYASTPDEATRMVEESFPHLLIVDIMLADGANGLDWLRAVKLGELARIPSIVLTGSTERKDLEEALRMGVDDYILKPADFHIVSRKVYHVAHQLQRGRAFRFEAAAATPLRVKAELDATICGISETGVAVSSYAANPNPVESIALKTNLFDEIGIAQPHRLDFLNYESEVNSKRLGFPYRVFCQSKGWTDADRTRIRQWVQSQKLRRVY